MSQWYHNALCGHPLTNLTSGVARGHTSHNKFCGGTSACLSLITKAYDSLATKKLLQDLFAAMATMKWVWRQQQLRDLGLRRRRPEGEVLLTIGCRRCWWNCVVTGRRYHLCDCCCCCCSWRNLHSVSSHLTSFIPISWILISDDRAVRESNAGHAKLTISLQYPSEPFMFVLTVVETIETCQQTGWCIKLL